MKRLFYLPHQRATSSKSDEREHQERLEDAETRANALLRTAEWVASSVARRDQENHWQASVNRLFLGENT